MEAGQERKAFYQKWSNVSAWAQQAGNSILWYFGVLTLCVYSVMPLISSFSFFQRCNVAGGRKEGGRGVGVVMIESERCVCE